MHLYKIFKSFLRLFNLSITMYDFYEKLKKNQKDLENFKILVALDRTDIEKKKTTERGLEKCSRGVETSGWIKMALRIQWNTSWTSKWR